MAPSNRALPNVTEDQWLQAKEIRALDAGWIAKNDSRKWHLFASACCRRVLALGPDPLIQLLIESTDEFADGLRTWKEMTKLRKRFRDEYRLPPGIRTPARKVAFGLSHAMECLTRRVVHNAQRVTDPCATAAASGSAGDWTAAYHAEHVAHVALAHEVFGNPFRPVSFSPEWRTLPSSPSPKPCTTHETSHRCRCSRTRCRMRAANTKTSSPTAATRMAPTSAGAGLSIW